MPSGADRQQPFSPWFELLLVGLVMVLLLLALSLGLVALAKLAEKDANAPAARSVLDEQ